MKKNYSKGFTLIELLVVVAIIGLLASVVLASLNSARSKGTDAAVKSNLKNAQTQAEIVFNTRTDHKNTYQDVCNNSNTEGLVDGTRGVGAQILAAAEATGLTEYFKNRAGSTTAATCNNNDDEWAFEAPLKSGGMWCIDSTGNSKEEPGTSFTAADDYTCI